MSFLNLSDPDLIEQIGALEFNYTAGDDLPELTAVLQDVDLTGYAITLHLRRPDDTILTVTATAVDLAAGCFKFVFGTTDLQAGYDQDAEIQFTTGGGRIQTSPKFKINVAEQLA